MAKAFTLEPRKVPPVETKHRTICTPIPVPESIPIFEALRKGEPQSMQGQPLILWDHAQGMYVHDRFGNRWLDFSSGVLVASAGHARQEIVDAVVKTAQAPMLHSYCFANEPRVKLIAKLTELAPAGLKTCMLLTTGSEAIECALKLAFTWARKIDPQKNVIVSFQGDFHGRTLGSQLAGGIPGLKGWIPNDQSLYVNAPWPGDMRVKDKSFAGFEKALADRKIDPQRVAAVLFETYQGGNVGFMPLDYASQLKAWANKHGALVIADEVQAGFGRTGKRFGFEHYKFTPDLAVFGKGISSSLPLSAVLGRTDVMNLYGPNEMTSTHTGNPICCAAALANLDLIVGEQLAERAAELEPVMMAEIEKLKTKYPQHIGAVQGRGLVSAIQCVKPGTDLEPHADLAWEVVRGCVESGLMLFAPVGFGGSSVKISPPLICTKEQLLEGLGVIAAQFELALKKKD
ncbi:MAG: aspartate aminotransferase family protein [Planctomycetota bacterium]